MNSKERIRALFDNKPADRVGFWLGHPADKTKILYANALGISLEDHVEHGVTNSEGGLLATNIDPLDVEISAALKSDMMWISPEVMAGSWKHPEGKPMFDTKGGQGHHELSGAGVFSDCEDARQIESFDWPDPAYLDFEPARQLIQQASDKGMAVVGGMWMSFFHVLSDFFGMENYFMKMYTHPAVVEAATEKMVDFYIEANKRCLETLDGGLDVVFFGNDVGSQLDLLISPDAFKKFILPSYKRIVNQAKNYDLKVMLHSCGAIRKIIPDLIEVGIDALHPLQAKAEGMGAAELSSEYGDSLLFVGGVDTQDLLPFGTPQQVRDEVRRLKDTFGSRYIVSPSHEAILSNVPIQNVVAMMDTALKMDDSTDVKRLKKDAKIKIKEAPQNSFSATQMKVETTK